MACRRLLLLLFLFSIVLNARTQDYIFNRLSIQDGLLSNNILCAVQDTTGYIWLGTETGLQRYDGYNFKVAWRERIDQVLIDNHQQLWIRSGKKIGIFNPQLFSFNEVNYEKNIEGLDASWLKLRKDQGGNIFLTITRNNCQYFDEKQKAFSRRNNPFQLPDSLQLINVVEDDKQSRYWILSYNGFGYWDKAAKAYYDVAHNLRQDPLLQQKDLPAVINNFFIDRLNKYWIEGWNGTERKFACFDPLAKSFTNDTIGLGDAGNGSYYDVYGFTEFDDSIAAVYGLNCLRYEDRGRFRELRDTRPNPFGIQFNSVTAILQDRERMLWFATDNGLFYTSSNLNRNIHVILSQDKERAAINAVLEENKEHLWIGTWGRGVFILNSITRNDVEIAPVSKLQFPDGFTKLVWSMCKYRPTNSIWIGCQQGRLMIYHTTTATAKLFIPTAFKHSTVRQVVNHTNGTIWFGLNNGDLLVCKEPAAAIRESSFRKVYHFEGHIKKIIPVDAQRMWVTVNGKGIYLFDSRQEQIVLSYDNKNVQTDLVRDINDMLPLSDSTWLLAGDQLGIVNTKTSVLEFFSSLNNLSPGKVFSLQKAADNEYWIAGSNGIFRFNPFTKNLTRYSQRDGLISIHNSGYIPETGLVQSDQRVVFAGNQHLVMFDPAQYRPVNQPPAVSITGFQINQQYLRLDSLQALKKIRIPYAGNSFTVEFAAISFLQLEKLTYEYKMEGLDENWTTLKNPAPLKYNALTHGNYKLLIRVKNDAGKYSAQTTTLFIYIVPPFWRTFWFYALIGVIISGLLYYLHRMRVERLLHVEKVRSRLARDLHDDMGSTLSTINILSNIALQQNPLDEKASKEYMTTINSSTTQMMEAMDDIVWSINPVNDNMQKVLARMKEIAGTVLEPQLVDYTFQVENEVKELSLPMELRREIFLIFKEALNNIVKYAKASNVVFTLKKNNADLLLLIEDDGVGFDPSIRTSATRGNGMKNMKKRAETIKADFAVASQPGKGTHIKLSIPLA